MIQDLKKKHIQLHLCILANIETFRAVSLRYVKLAVSCILISDEEYLGFFCPIYSTSGRGSPADQGHQQEEELGAEQVRQGARQDHLQVLQEVLQANERGIRRLAGTCCCSFGITICTVCK